MPSRNHTMVGWSKNKPTRMTTTSVSTVRTSTVSAPCSKACRMWTMILVSASLWLQSSIGTDSPHADTACPDVTQTLLEANRMTLFWMLKRQTALSCLSGHLKNSSNCLVSWLSQTLSSVHPFLSFHE